MAGISWTRDSLIESLVELAGFKAGLVLSRDELKSNLPQYSDLLDGDPEEVIRTRAEDFHGLAQALLHALGAATTVEPVSAVDLYARYYPDRQKLDAHNAVFDIAWKRTKTQLLSGDDGPIDLRGLIAEATAHHGALGGQVATDLCDLANRAANESPWNRMRYVDWQDEIELESLFKDANLSTAYGTFLDQSFIDYLSRNFGAIDKIHWRKFEGLAAEYFQQEGAQVRLGPGSNDDGVDIRIWWPGDDVTRPATMLVQCKREKAKVGRPVLKALYADICHERAKSGLIVTTRALSPGAIQTTNARQYPIDAADRTTLKTWIDKMRSEHVRAVK